MSFGKMNTFIDIVEPRKTKDSEGFAATEDVVVASLRAYREGRQIGRASCRERVSINV